MGGALALAWSLASLGGLLERRPWAPALEAVRLAGAAAWAVAPAPAGLGAVVLAALSALWLLRGRKRGLPLRPALR